MIKKIKNLTLWVDTNLGVFRLRQKIFSYETACQSQLMLNLH